MNKQERIIAILLGLALVGWMFYSNKQAAQRAREAAKYRVFPPGVKNECSCWNRMQANLRFKCGAGTLVETCYKRFTDQRVVHASLAMDRIFAKG